MGGDRPTFFHLDISGRLQPGMTLHPGAAARVQLGDGPPMLEGFLPDGLASHGGRILLTPARTLGDGPLRWLLMELAFELVRREGFWEAPSRFSTLFAYDTLDALRPGDGPAGPHVYRVEGAGAWKADHAWTDQRGGSVLELLAAGACYWAGAALDPEQPVWEYLLSFPVRVLRRVEPGAVAEPHPAPVSDPPPARLPARARGMTTGAGPLRRWQKLARPRA